MVIFPMLFGLESNYQFYGVEKEVTKFANTNGIPVYSLTPAFLGQRSSALWVLQQ